MQHPPAPQAPPTDFDEFRIERLLGRGAMGEVYLARDLALDRLVAIKFVAVAEVDAAARHRFFLEARALARVQSPNVVAVYRIGEVQGRPYLVSEYVPGRSLDLLDRPVDWQSVLAISRDMARGLAAVHRFGVLHRDIKPANAILGPDGTVKLVDFGLAELVDLAIAESLRARTGVQGAPLAGVPQGGQATMSLALSGTVAAPSPAQGISSQAASVVGPQTSHVRRIAGTPLYMAPELWHGQAASPRSDVYSLGVMMYELATGAAPFAAASLDQLPMLAVNGSVRPAGEIAPGLDSRLSLIIARCLRVNPAERFSSEELREALDSIASQAAIQSSTYLVLTSRGQNPWRDAAAPPIQIRPPSQPAPPIQIRPPSQPAPPIQIRPASQPAPAPGLQPYPANLNAAVDVGPTVPVASAAHSYPSQGYAPPYVVAPVVYQAAATPIAAPRRAGFPWGVTLGCTGVILGLSFVAAGGLFFLVKGRLPQVLGGCSAESAKPMVHSSTILGAQPAYREDELMRAVEPRLYELRDCYAQALTREPCLEGQLTLMFSLDASGHVSHVMPSALGISDKGLRACSTARASAWTFPKSRTGSLGSFMYTFQFTR